MTTDHPAIPSPPPSPPTTPVAAAPIVIFGVPRSGTTLLRTLLDAHGAIAAGPEAPWLAEHQPRSVLGLVRYLAEDQHGLAANFGASRDEIFAAARAMVDQLMSGYAQRRGKRRWAHKTPNDILQIESVLELLPDARIIWIVRDGMDVAMSTAITAEHRKGLAPLYEKKLRLAPTVLAPSSPALALVRWGLWNHRIRRVLAGRAHMMVRYEQLVQAPEMTLRALCDFIGEPFDAAMLRYDTARHDLPTWEWGSADVRAHRGIDAERAGRAQRELDPRQRSALALLAEQDFVTPTPIPVDDAAVRTLAELLDPAAEALGAEAIGDDAARLGELRSALTAARDQPYLPEAPGNAAATLAPLVAAARGAVAPVGLPASMAAAIATAGIEPVSTGRREAEAAISLANLRELRSQRFCGYMDELNAFARTHNLREMLTWSKIWEYPWLWFNALSQVDWRGKRVVDLGSELSPMPWMLASLGAEVLLVEADAQWIGRWERVQTALGTSVRWSIVDNERIDAPDGWADAVISFSVIEHQPDKRAAIDEAARVLKKGGLFALSFDICEPQMQMTFPEWNGHALTMAEFEREIWRHPAFDAGRAPDWNLADIPGFLAWHRSTATHHNYVTAAAVLVRH